MVARALPPVVRERDGVPAICLREADIWDGSDLAAIRESLDRLIARDGRRRVGVDMTHVKHLPSGYFGMLMDWRDRGADVLLFDPQPNVRAMLWFRRFAEPIGDGRFRLAGTPLEDSRPTEAAATPRLSHAERLDELSYRLAAGSLRRQVEQPSRSGQELAAG